MSGNRIGVCGFAEAQDRMFADFDFMEVQKSFYQPPRESTAARWRGRAPPGFAFTLKAWQLITHERSSPTYRRLKERLSERDLPKAGSFRWNAVTRMAWERTQQIAEALGAHAIVFQTPAGFRPRAENLDRMTEFIGRIECAGRRLIFEPRGKQWNDATVRGVVRELNLVHAVDPLVRRPVGRGLRYFRLHGLPAYNYKYRYSDQDLADIASRISLAWPNWIAFNNDNMAEDARRLRRLLDA